MEILMDPKSAGSIAKRNGSNPFFSPKPIQAKLEVNCPGDVYEVEADQIAERVLEKISDSNTTENSVKQKDSSTSESINQSGISNPVPTSPSKNAAPNHIQTKCEDCEAEEILGEKQVQRRVDSAISLQAAGTDDYEDSSLKTKRSSTLLPTVSQETTAQLFASKGGGDPLQKNTRAEMERGFGVDFSGVRIYDGPSAVEMSKNLGAQAFTHGSDIYFNQEKSDTQSEEGKSLLAHELTHVVQQKAMGHNIIMRAMDDASVDAEFNAWADENKKTKDKTHADFPWAVWDFIRPQIVDIGLDPLPKPDAKDAKGLQKWNENFAKAEIIGRWLFTLKANTKNPDIGKDAENKAYYILDSLAKAGFVSKSMAQSGSLDTSHRSLVYETILKKPSLVAASELETIVTFQCNGQEDPGQVPIVQDFTNGKASELKSLKADQTKAILKVLINKYGAHSTIIDAIAELLMFNSSVRIAVSDALMGGTFGTPEIMFKVLKHKYFVEPEYGASVIKALKPDTMSDEEYENKRMTDDMPWVYTHKQKYYVQYLVDLAKGQGITIAPPTAMTFAGLKTWLETNTEKIGEAAAKKYTADPGSVFEIYSNIADIFFYHIPHDRDAAPNLEGKISHLIEGKPSKKRFEADCDVFATYAMRFLHSGGMEPIGYIAFIPIGTDAARAAHVGAMVRKGGTYYVINNKGILETGITEESTNAKKGDALKELRKLAFENAYGDPRPENLKIYYSDAEAKGKMPQLFKDQDSSLLRTDL